MNQTEVEVLKREIAHIFEMVKSFIERRNQVNNIPIEKVGELLIAWEEFKKMNWWESEALDVEKILIDNFQKMYTLMRKK